MKKIISIILALVMIFSLSVSALATSDTELKNTADALYSLGLLKGYGKNSAGQTEYGLMDSLTREDGLILLLRMLGEEDDAEAYSGTKHPFKDVRDSYYDKYISYAYSKMFTKGVSNTEFGYKQKMTNQQFMTFCLRALGYQDDGSAGNFEYKNAVAFAAEKGLSCDNTQTYNRGNAVTVLWKTLNTVKKGSATKLYAALGISDSAFNTAQDIQANGVSTDADVGGGSSGGGGSVAPSNEKKIPDAVTNPDSISGNLPNFDTVIECNTSGSTLTLKNKTSNDVYCYIAFYYSGGAFLDYGYLMLKGNETGTFSDEKISNNNNNCRVIVCNKNGAPICKARLINSSPSLPDAPV